MSVRSIVLGLVLWCTVAVAQTGLVKSKQTPRIPVTPERARIQQPASAHLAASSPDTVRILALMVDFQTSTGNLTTGTGKFQLETTSAVMIDPPPHDSSYFAAKLQFLSNYFRKVSNGKMIVRGEVLGRVVTLPKQMSSYSPAKDGSNDKPLANLVVESWRLADSLNPAIQFNKFQAFIIFHAGVGRDLDLVSALGYDPAPFDIPSLTFNLATLRAYLGDPTYACVPVDGGSFRITNTMVLPETETRLLPTSGRADTLQGSINGLLANSFGSYLGLPDLFNTKTGMSGIGMFGLMDVAGGINFFGGLFPPEPSAWEKIHLGWVTPITVGQGTSTIELPAVGLKTGRDTVYKIPITDTEYFLMENRSRDPHGNGQTVTVRRGNSTTTLAFPTDTAGFNPYDVRAINGSVVDVEDFDWAVPGLTSYGTAFAGGGILIWHIDENIISRNLATNTVNADLSHPGVYVKEADGSRDIGRTYDPFSEPGAGSEYGSPLDFWFEGNLSPVYKNVFDKDSHPDSRSYSGASSLVSVKGFGPKSSRMKATVELGNSQFRRIQGFARTFAAGLGPVPLTATSKTILAGVDGKIFAFDQLGASRTKDPAGLLSAKGGGFSAGAVDLGNGVLIAGAQDSTLMIMSAAAASPNGVLENIEITSVPLGEKVSVPPMFADLSPVASIVVGTSRGTVARYTYTGTLQKKVNVSSSPVTSLAQLPTASLSKPADLFFACGGRLYSEQSSVALGDSSLPWIVAGAVNRSGDFLAVGQRGGGRIAGFTRDLSRKLFDVNLSSDTLRSLSAADVDADGEKDVIAVMKSRLIVINTSGAILNGFPIVAPSGESFVGDALVAELAGDSDPEILAALSTGDLVAYSKTGSVVPGFPIRLFSGGQASLALLPSSGGSLGVVSLTTSGQMQAAEILRPYNATWTQSLRDSRHSNSDASSGGTAPVSSEFLPKSRVYNWPNPAYGASTNIRFYTSENAAVTITIFDLAGMKITELKAQSRAGQDGEVSWDLSSIQSGVYLGRVEAAGSSRSEVAFIKIAVVK